MSIILYNVIGDNMKTVGIIVEYNPLHNGHLHHIEETRKQSNCDCLIAVMSPNFTQRGEPAMIDKFTRTKMALQNQVDLVVELPFVFAVQSADIFAYTSVSILHHLGVDEIYFGSESGIIEELYTLADVLDSEDYNKAIKKYLDQGLSYPTSSNNAMNDVYPNEAYNQPNNILGIQYIKALKKLKSKIQINTIIRANTGYFDELSSGKIQSATAIRKAMKSNQEITEFVPSSVGNLLKDRKIIDLNNFTEYFKYNIHSLSNTEINSIVGFEEGFENRLLKVKEFNTVDELIHKSITRRYTNSKIRRALIHLLVNTKKEELVSFEIPYIRVLGMNDTGKNYLSSIKKDFTPQIISKVKEGIHPYLDIELRASKIYGLASDIDVFKEEFKPLIYLRFN